MFLKNFPGPWYQRTACEDVAENLEWAHHPWRTVQGIQNLWEFPEETLSQISSKKISKFPCITHMNGWGKSGKKWENTILPSFHLSYNFANCAEIFSSTQGTAISFTRPVLPPGLVVLGWIISQQNQPWCWDPSQKPRHSIFQESKSFHLQQQWAALSKAPQQWSRSGFHLPLSLWLIPYTSVNSLH